MKVYKINYMSKKIEAVKATKVSFICSNVFKVTVGRKSYFAIDLREEGIYLTKKEAKEALKEELTLVKEHFSKKVVYFYVGIDGKLFKVVNNSYEAESAIATARDGKITVNKKALKNAIKYLLSAESQELETN